MNTEASIRVIIFDDNHMLLDSVSMLIEETDGMELAGAFSECTRVVADVKETQPDVVIMDIDMPQINGIEAVRLIRIEFPLLPILMQTVFDDDEKVFAALKAGAVGYILKNTEPDNILQAVKEVHNGGAPMSPSIARKVLLQFRSSEDKHTFEDYKLTARENEVLQLLVLGLPIKLIADKMFITYDTVRAHIKKIYQKLHVASMTEAVAKAINQKLLPDK
jgi:DNA-binding NarL/FixJ family response regulator